MAAAVLVGAGAALLGLAAGWGSWSRLGAGAPTDPPAVAAVRPPSPPSPPSAPTQAPPPQSFRQLSPTEAAAYNASIPIAASANPPSAPFRLAASPADYEQAANCLAAAVYYEAASQSLEGQRAVAQVVLNRLASPIFPKTVCGVVFQGADLPTGCQFTFTCDGSLDRPPSRAGWSEARAVATAALAGYVEPLVGRATHYHTFWVVPVWSATLTKVANIGAHIFYVWPAANVSAVRAYAGGEASEARLLVPDEALAVAAPEPLIAAPAPAAGDAQPASPPPKAIAAAPGVRDLAAVLTIQPPQAIPAAAPDRPARAEAGNLSRLPVPGDW